MKHARRHWLKAGLTAGVGSLLAGCAQIVRTLTPPALPSAAALDHGAAPPLVRALRRVTFGPSAAEVERVSRMGWEEFVEQQLQPEAQEGPLYNTLPNDEAAAVWRVHSADLMQLPVGDLFNFREHEVLTQLQQTTLLRAVCSRWQLREVMVDFWTNHFNIYARKYPCAYLKVGDDRDVIRPHALGKFRDLLSASVHSPAMLTYLDNQANKSGKANENYARELLELHTLGVHGNYTQDDVQAVARCFTGWSVQESWRRGQFVFRAPQHDSEPKTVLGISLPQGQGQEDGERVIEILAEHPSTARFLARKLCLRFLGCAPEDKVAVLAEAYQRSDGDIRAMLRPLLLSLASPEAPIAPLTKRPLDFVVSALRALAADTDGGPALQEHLAAMGQPLFQWPMPDGFPWQTSAWTGSLLARWNFALALTAGDIPGTQLDLPALQQLGAGNPVDLFLMLLWHRPATDEPLQRLRRVLEKHLNQTGSVPEMVALALAAPSFQWL